MAILKADAGVIPMAAFVAPRRSQWAGYGFQCTAGRDLTRPVRRSQGLISATGTRPRPIDRPAAVRQKMLHRRMIRSGKGAQANDSPPKACTDKKPAEAIASRPKCLDRNRCRSYGTGLLRPSTAAEGGPARTAAAFGRAD